MRRVLHISAVLIVLSVVVPGTASAQDRLGAPDFKDRFTEEFVEDDFCGTGASIQVVETVVGNVWGARRLIGQGHVPCARLLHLRRHDDLCSERRTGLRRDRRRSRGLAHRADRGDGAACVRAGAR